ncbi:MAG: hypothetical protein IT374_27895 [Polyangiaceae bacterium]|nr:hypothetical protein [Polyangiaceae bacterium]
MIPLLLITCKLPSCQRRFLVCSRCFRGHKYCSTDHAQQAREASVRKARLKYAQSEKGLKAQKARSQRYYLKKTRENSHTDRSSTTSARAGTLRRGAAPKGSSSARAKHADDIPPPEFLLAPGAPDRAPRVHCLWCRRAGNRVLFRARRFQR